jgi:hypothetical protein
MWLCPQHHALEHLLERARKRTGPTYFTTKHRTLTSGRYKIGARVVVKRVTKVEEPNPEVNKYLGLHGKVVLWLPDEWNLGRQYRVEFDDPTFPPLAFFARELAPEV